MARAQQAITFVDDHMLLHDTLDGMLSSCYKKRMQAEYQQLTIRMRSLNRIIQDYVDNCLDFEIDYPIEWLHQQYEWMSRYRSVLKHILALEHGCETAEDIPNSEGGTTNG